MTITTTKLTRAAGLPPSPGGCCSSPSRSSTRILDATFTTTTEYAVRETMKIFMAVFSLIGITGIYLRQVRQIGVLGLIGYVVLGVGYLAIFSVQIIGVFVLPTLRPVSPATSTTSSPWPPAAPRSATSARLQILIQGGGIAYIVGGIIFGIALFRAKSSPGGPQRSSPSAPSPPSPPPCCPSSPNGCSPFRSASP